jgi:hypothetical protein
MMPRLLPTFFREEPNFGGPSGAPIEAVGSVAASRDFSYPYYSKACGGACKRDFGGDEK